MAKAATKPAAAPKAPLRLGRGATHVRGYYDAAQTTEENQRHWAAADALGARAAHNPAVRRMLRTRCRYEVANSPLARSILKKKADFVVGTGPRPQVLTVDATYNRAVAEKFYEWTVVRRFARKLWMMRFGRSQDGEQLGVCFTNLASPFPVKLDLRNVEADQLANPLMSLADNGSDGIFHNDYGDPVLYRVLKQHPGETALLAPLVSGLEYDDVPARDVVHYFSPERPGQTRGVPEVSSALPLFAMRRRYMLAVLGAAEWAASMSGVLKTQQAPGDPDELEPLDAIDFERNTLLTMPKGWEPYQIKSEQPATTFEMFDAAIIREIARCVNMPYGIAASDSSDYNFASAKLDLTPWFQTVRIEQDELEDTVVDPIFDKWYAEAALIPGYLPKAPSGDRKPPPRAWFWDGTELLDPREMGAKSEGLRTGQTTHNRIWAQKGYDVEAEWEAQAKLLGISLDEYRRRVADAIFNTGMPSPPATAEQQERADEGK